MAQKRPQLVVTVEGVLASDPLTYFWNLMAAATDCSSEEIQLSFTQMLGEDLFSGRVSESAFWEWLAAQFGITDSSYWKELLLERRYPLLGMHLLPRLSSEADITLLCGQRHEWFADLIQAEDAAYAVSRVVYSSKVGLTKRDSALYEKLFESGRANLWLDNSQHALQLAKTHHFNICVADREMQWVDPVVAWLQQQTGSEKSGWRGLLAGR